MNKPEIKILRKRYSIPVAETDPVSALFDVPDGYGTGGSVMILAHGAGKDMTSPLLESVATGLPRTGYPVFRFNFPYKEKGKKAPDPPGRLIRTWASALEFVRITFSPDVIIAAGKSMGGRIASQMAAEEQLPVDKLIFYGYPLHPPGRKDKLRDAHLYDIEIPMLFFAGTRDSLCDLDLLNMVLNKLEFRPALEIIAGGDHSFRVLKSLKMSEDDIHSLIIQKTADWLGQSDRRIPS